MFIWSELWKEDILGQIQGVVRYRPDSDAVSTSWQQHIVVISSAYEYGKNLICRIVILVTICRTYKTVSLTANESSSGAWRNCRRSAAIGTFQQVCSTGVWSSMLI